MRITAAEALRHSYFAESSNKPAMYIPRINFKESSSCPTYLIEKTNDAKVRLIIKEEKSLLSVITSLDRSRINQTKISLINEMFSTLRRDDDAQQQLRLQQRQETLSFLRRLRRIYCSWSHSTKRA
ncbi:unnamed protein product [Sphagnum balticum]